MNNITENYIFYLEPYYDNLYNSNGDYYHIITLNKKPKGPIAKYIKLIKIKNISTKINKAHENYCTFVINKSITSITPITPITPVTPITPITTITTNSICTLDDISEIYDYLLNNNYEINNELTHIITSMNNNSKKILFTAKYTITQ